MSARCQKRSEPVHGALWQARSLCLRAVLLLAALLLVLSSTTSRADVSKEYQVKAAFVYNFAKFVEWPPHRFADGAAPIVIGVFGKNPFGTELESIVRGRKINNRDIVVKQVDTIEQARETHILFFSRAEDSEVTKVLDDLRGRGVLTVGESDAFGAHSGMIQFLLDEGKVRFEINVDAAEAEGVKINAQLLKLATGVRRKK